MKKFPGSSASRRRYCGCYNHAFGGMAAAYEKLNLQRLMAARQTLLTIFSTDHPEPVTDFANLHQLNA